MKDYNEQDVKSVLEYIYENYGSSVFQEKGKIKAFFNDLAPRLNKDGSMLKILDESGVLKSLCSVDVKDVEEQKKALKIAEAKVTKDTPLDSEYVVSFLQILSEVLGWKYQSFQADRQKGLSKQQKDLPKEPEPPVVKKQKAVSPPALKKQPELQTQQQKQTQKKTPPVPQPPKAPKKRSPVLFLVIAALLFGAFSLGKSFEKGEKTAVESTAASFSLQAAVSESAPAEEPVVSDATSSAVSAETAAGSEALGVSEAAAAELLDPNGTYQKIFVEATGSSAHLTLITYREGEWVEELSTTAAIGSNGITYNKTEGDHMTPAGTFSLGFVFSDSAQDTKMPFVKIDENSVWVCDPNSSFYNTLQSKNNPARDWSDSKGNVEKMNVKFSKKSSSACIYFEFNGDGQTQYSAENYNGGSALFLDGVGANGNMYSGYGDIKISGSDMKKLLKLLEPSLNPIITIEPA